MGRLSKENVLINEEVNIRTAELNKALKATREARNELDALTRIDPLTGLANRRSLDSFINEEWKRGLRSGKPIAVIMIDIDFFKNYNDTLGHSAGDSCLKQISSLLKSEMARSSDFIARYGGEEFLCLCPETDHKGADIIAHKLLSAVASSKIHHPTSGITDHVTVSIGIATMVPSHDSTPQRLVELADSRLYKAKKNGRNQVYSGKRTEKNY
jgi:diguanylate cyclase (GGDEF)-like protein